MLVQDCVKGTGKSLHMRCELDGHAKDSKRLSPTLNPEF